MRPSRDGWAPPAGAGGMPGGLPGGMPGESKTPKRREPDSWRETAELASEAARAEGASTPAEPSSRRAGRSPTVATSRRAEGGWLAAGADEAEQAGPLLRVGGDQQPHRRGPAPARQPRDDPLAVVAGGAAGWGGGDV